MADNWLNFSEVIANLTAEQEQWIKHQLEGIAIVGGKEYSYLLGSSEIEIERGNFNEVDAEDAEFAGCRAYRDMEGYDFGMYGDSVGFEYELSDDKNDPDAGWGRYMWLYSEESADLERVGHFVQKFLRKFRPKVCWSLTYAETCSKPRVGEFGGGAVFVTAAEIKYKNAYGFIEQQTAEFVAQ